MWVWVPTFLLASYERAAWSLQAARLAAFAVIAVGAAGCISAGLLADRVGRTTVTIGSLVVSGSCALTAGLLFTEPGVLMALCLMWGFAVVADSAQFSAAVSELIDPRYVGTALTVQMSLGFIMSLGFMLTLLTIQLIPPLVTALGWENEWHQSPPREALPPDNCASVIHADHMKQLFREIDAEYTDLCHGPRLLCLRMISHDPESILTR